MKMKKWIISTVAMIFVLGTVGSLTAFALAADGGTGNLIDMERSGTISPGLPTYEEWLADVGNDVEISRGSDPQVETAA